MASPCRKDLLQEYHRLAADTLLGEKSHTVSKATLEAAESGQYDRLQSLLSEHQSTINLSDPQTGDTPIIVAARNNHTEVVDLLIKSGADVTLENVNGEGALDVSEEKMRRHILEQLTHEDRSMTNAQTLLQSAWLGDAVSVKKCLSGSHYIDVNCSNCNGVSPLLLVTKDLALFTEVQAAMETDYDPVGVLEELLANQADVNQSDQFGHNPLHLVAESGSSIHARKMVSLLLSHGSSPESLDSSSLSPVHIASAKGHVAIIVALVEEGGADVNMKGGESGDTALMLSVRGGHREAARYLLSQGADVTRVDDKGDCALSVARSPGMKRILRKAWRETTQENKAPSLSKTTSSASDSKLVLHPKSPRQPPSGSVFLTDCQEFENKDCVGRRKTLSESALETPHVQDSRSSFSHHHSEEESTSNRHHCQAQRKAEPRNYGNQVMHQRTGGEKASKATERKLKGGKREGKVGKKSKGKEGKRRCDPDAVVGASCPSRLVSQVSTIKGKGVRASHMTREGGVVIEIAAETRRETKLPEVAQSPPSPFQASIPPHSITTSIMIAVDPEKKVYKYSHSPRRSKIFNRQTKPLVAVNIDLPPIEEQMAKPSHLHQASQHQRCTQEPVNHSFSPAPRTHQLPPLQHDPPLQPLILFGPNQFPQEPSPLSISPVPRPHRLNRVEPVSDSHHGPPVISSWRKKKPDMKYITLIKYCIHNEEKEFRLLQKIQHKCDDIGTLLGVPMNTVDSHKTREEQCKDVFRKWLERGSSEYKVEWDGLIKVLQDVEMSIVAEDLKTALDNSIHVI